MYLVFHLSIIEYTTVYIFMQYIAPFIFSLDRFRRITNCTDINYLRSMRHQDQMSFDNIPGAIKVIYFKV